MIVVPHGAPEGYEWFVALVVLVGLCFAVCTFMRNAKPLDGLRRERQDLPAPNPIRPGPGPEDRLRDLQRRFHAVSPAIGESAPASDTLFRANELRRYYRSAKIAAVAAILAFAVVWGLSLPFGGASRASWHNPDLYFFLCLLTGLAASLAIIYECILKFCRRKPPLVEPRCSSVNVKTVDPPSPPKHPPPPHLKKAKPLDGLQRDRPRLAEEREEIDKSSRQAGKQAAEQFSRLCESLKDAPPKEQASRVREHFGIVGGARPAEGRGRKGKRS